MAAVRWTRSPNLIGAEIRSRKERVRSGLVELAGSHAARAEGEMKARAPWNDRSGAARAGLFGQVTSSGGDAIEIVLGHTVNYGVFLELGTSKMAARPIILPVANETAPKLAADASELVRRLFGS